MNDHEQWEEDVRARRNFILTIAGAVLLAVILLVFWWNNRSNSLPVVAIDEPPSIAAEGAQAQPTLPTDTPPTVADTDTVTLNPDLSRRTLPASAPTVTAADDPALSRPAYVGERIVIGGDVVDKFEADSAPPEGWGYLPEFGASPIFDLQENGDGQGHTLMLVDTRQNAGVLQKDVNVTLDPDTTLRWQWNILSLPSELPEDTAATHDFFSIAVEFDNGQDLTYMWSAELLDGTSFRCPLPEWNERETHVVVRSGEGSLNQWLHEERSLLADYERYIGGAPPARVTQVWLMASSAQQKGEGRAVFMDISLGGEGPREQVL